MENKEYLARPSQEAHDKHKKQLKQTYYDHSLGVLKRADEKAQSFLRFYTGQNKDSYSFIVRKSSEYHDPGKLDEITQEVFQIISSQTEQKRLKIGNHVVTGFLWAREKYIYYRKQYAITKDINDRYNFEIFWSIAILIVSHHLGIAFQEGTKLNSRYVDEIEFNDKISQRNDLYLKFGKEKTTGEYYYERLDNFINLHKKIMNLPDEEPKSPISYTKELRTFSLRMLLSCLVEGDHGDASIHNGGQDILSNNLELLPDKRIIKALEILKKYKEQKSLKKISKNEKKRDIVRDSLLEDIKKCCLNSSFYLLGAYTGCGKTFSGFVLALRLAAEYKLKRIFYVSPLNQITIQTVKYIREHVTLENENSAEIVGEHHCQADYWGKAREQRINSNLLKEESKLWNTPIVCTSSVQFYETLISNNPSKLRKLSNLAGSVIILDEFHSGLPIDKIRLILKILCELERNHSCKIIFMSGSPTEFWNIERLKFWQEPNCSFDTMNICDVVSCETKSKMIEVEKNRIKYIKIPGKNNIKTILNIVKKKSGPKVIVLNTIKTTAIVASKARKKFGAENVIHISSALSYKDKIKCFNRIENEIKTNKNLVVVATAGSIDTGVDLSFKNAFIEQRSVFSVLQLGGRVNRGHEYRGKSAVYVFDLVDKDEEITTNPMLLNSIKVLNYFLNNNKISPEFCTEALQSEIDEMNISNNGDNGKRGLKTFEMLEATGNFYQLNKDFKIIDDLGSFFIIVDKEIERKIRNKEEIFYKEFNEKGVQLKYFTEKQKEKILNDSKIEVFINEDTQEEFYIWKGEYDGDFLGYMEEIVGKNEE